MFPTMAVTMPIIDDHCRNGDPPPPPLPLWAFDETQSERLELTSKGATGGIHMTATTVVQAGWIDGWCHDLWFIAADL